MNDVTAFLRATAPDHLPLGQDMAEALVRRLRGLDWPRCIDSLDRVLLRTAENVFTVHGLADLVNGDQRFLPADRGRLPIVAARYAGACRLSLTLAVLGLGLPAQVTRPEQMLLYAVSDSAPHRIAAVEAMRERGAQILQGVVLDRPGFAAVLLASRLQADRSGTGGQDPFKARPVLLRALQAGLARAGDAAPVAPAAAAGRTAAAPQATAGVAQQPAPTTQNGTRRVTHA